MTDLAKTKPQSLSSLFDWPGKWQFLTKNWFGDDIWKDLFDENTASNIYETDTEYVLEYSKAGIPQDKWDIEIKDNTIFIKAENSVENEEKDEEKKYYKKSFQSIKINENYRIPQNADASNIDANYKDGVLKITIPKVVSEESSETNKIEVK